MITTRTWAIAGASAALILVPAGASYAATTASDGTPPTAIERVQLRQDHQANYGGTAAGMYRSGHGDPAQNPSEDYTRDQVRGQLRDTENCDGDGPIGDGTGRGGMMGDGIGRGGMMGEGTGRGGMMGGHGSGR